MAMQSLAYFVYGLSLVVLFGIIIAYYYSGKRHTKGEEIKHKMLEDDE